MRSFERSILFADRQPRSFVVASEPASTAMVRKPDVTSDENSAEANCAISRSPVIFAEQHEVSVAGRSL
jgi:hypothetical protein